MNKRTRLLATAALGMMLVVMYALFAERSTVDLNIAHYFAENLHFRRNALLLPPAKRDEVVFRLPAPVCQDKIVQAVRSAVILRNRCTRCDFAITLVVESPKVYAFLESSKEAHAVFDSIVETSTPSSLAETLLFVPKLPFVVYLDTRVISNHRFFPEALFDMLHKEYE